MKLVFANPPLIDEIDAKFHVKGKAIFYAWGDTIYSPGGITPSAEIKAHEGVHGQRQTNDDAKIIEWWNRYLTDVEFRLDEEIKASRAEYGCFCNRTKDRNARSQFLHHVAGKVASPLYGSMITSTAARILIAN